MISTRIRQLLDDRGMTRADLARQTGIPYHRLNMWFARQGAKPNGPDIEAVARALGVSVSYLVSGGDPSPGKARDWISEKYASLDPEGRKQLEAFVQFLLNQQDNPGSKPDE